MISFLRHQRRSRGIETDLSNVKVRQKPLVDYCLCKKSQFLKLQVNLIKTN